MTHQRRPNSVFSWCGRRPGTLTFVESNPSCGNCFKAAHAKRIPTRPRKTHLTRAAFPEETVCGKAAASVELAKVVPDAPTCRACQRKGAAP